jgi:hypothetical protein
MATGSGDHRYHKGGGALMERGPVALFGALVAVGLGPALWLGAQIGDVAAPPPRSPVVQSEQKADTAKPRGGEGAGAQPTEPEVAPQPKRKAKYVPATEAPTAGPSRSADAGGDEAEPVDTAEPTPTEEQTTQPSDDDSTAPGDTPGSGDDGGDDPGDDNPPQPPAQDPTSGGVGAGDVEQG